jgi:hypothetical protein
MNKNVIDYTITANKTGVVDSTNAIQIALNECYNAGGGTVYLPSGKYLVKSGIKIPAFVTLCGDWNDPDISTDYGTIIIADVPSTDEANPALFTIGGSAAAMGLTIYYPNQSITDVKPYPYTFYVNGIGENYMLQSVINCTVINGYRGIGVCIDEKNAHEMMSVETVKGCFLSVGATAYNQADVGTWKNLTIDNKYWAEASAEFAVTDKAALDEYTLNNAKGLVAGDLEWTEFANINISQRKVGVHVVKGKRIEFAGSFFDLNVTDCETGLLVDSIDERWGMVIARSNVSSIINNTKGNVKLTDVKVSGKQEGKITVCEADLSYLNVPYHAAPSEVKTNIITVKADKNLETDISGVLQQELDKAALSGGIVYLQAGKYRLSQAITIPAGVELRGSSSCPTRDQNGSDKGTVIFADYGKDTDTALITLDGDNAGICGIRFIYDKNPSSLAEPYSYTIRGNGKGVYAVNLCMVASDKGIDFRNCDNHFIKKIVGVWYTNIMVVGGKNGIVEGCLYNPSNYSRNSYGIEGWSTGERNIFKTLIDAVTRVKTDAIIVDESENQLILNTFAYGVKTFLVNNGGKDLTLVNVGADNIGKEAPLINTNGGSLIGVNIMRYNGISYVNNGTDLKLYNRLSINEFIEPAVEESSN